MKVEDKRLIVADLNQRLCQAKVAILTRFMGLNVEKVTQLRRELRKAAVEFRVVKNTLLRLAIQNTDKDVLSSHIHGAIAVAWSEADLVAPARVLAKFSKEFPELQILVAASEGKLWKETDIQAWVTLPSMESLRAKMIGLIQAPASRLVNIMATPGTRLAQVLKARSQQG